jgi:hypothetical protein
MAETDLRGIDSFLARAKEGRGRGAGVRGISSARESDDVFDIVDRVGDGARMTDGAMDGGVVDGFLDRLLASAVRP